MSAQDRQTLSLPSLRNLQAFIAVANALSIHQAAEQLNVTLRGQPSDRVAGVVDGQEIIHPQRQRVQLTPTGEKYLREVSAAMSAIGRATDQIVKEKDNAVLRVHSSPTFGLSWLLRRTGKFRAEYPDITINLTCSYENLQFARDNIDIDIRHGIPDWDAYRVMTIKTTRWWCWPRRNMRKTPHQHTHRSAATVTHLVHQHSGELGKMVRTAQYRQAPGSTSASALTAPI